MNKTRRELLKTGAGIATAGALSGCLSGTDPAEAGEGLEGYAAFFALWDWSEQVVGDVARFENAVDTGEMGHGWSPPGNLVRDIASSDAFVYLDSPEFGWAQDAASQIRQDHDDVAVIDAMQGMEDELLDWNVETDDDRTPDYDHDFGSDVEIEGFDLYNTRTGDQPADWHIDHWHGGLPDVPLDGSVSLEGVFEDDEGRVIPLGEQGFSFGASVEQGPEDIVRIESDGDTVEIHGEETGLTQIVFELRHEGDVVWDTSDDLAPVSVVEEVEGDGATELHDPHIWVDPVLAQDAVDTIAEGLADADPENAETYEENAASYKEELEEVHEEFEMVVDGAELDIGVFVGHNSYQYVEHRYGFDLHTPIGVSPDEQVRSEDVAESIRIVDEHGIDTVLYDPFETTEPAGDDIPEEARVILENTDATDAAPLTPAEGSTREWNERGWGWVDHMTEVNIPSLEQALNP